MQVSLNGDRLLLGLGRKLTGRLRLLGKKILLLKLQVVHLVQLLLLVLAEGKSLENRAIEILALITLGLLLLLKLLLKLLLLEIHVNSIGRILSERQFHGFHFLIIIFILRGEKGIQRKANKNKFFR